MEKLWKQIRHNQTLVISGILALAAVTWAYGCQPTVRSILHPDIRLDRISFQGEVEQLAALVESRFVKLEQQEKLKKALFELLGKFAVSGEVNPVSVLVTCLGLLGAGAVVDNGRKDVIIKTLKNNVTSKVT